MQGEPLGVHSTAFWVQKCGQGSKVWSAVPALASWNDSRKQHPGKGWAIENRTYWPTRLPSQVGEPKVPLVLYKDFHQHNRHSYHDSDCCIVVVVSIIVASIVVTMITVVVGHLAAAYRKATPFVVPLSVVTEECSLS